MSSTIFDAGDLQRLDREAQLTEEAPRQLPVEREESILAMGEEPVECEDDASDMLLDAVLSALKRRL